MVLRVGTRARIYSISTGAGCSEERREDASIFPASGGPGQQPGPPVPGQHEGGTHTEGSSHRGTTFNALPSPALQSWDVTASTARMRAALCCPRAPWGHRGSPAPQGSPAPRGHRDSPAPRGLTCPAGTQGLICPTGLTCPVGTHLPHGDTVLTWPAGTQGLTCPTVTHLPLGDSPARPPAPQEEQMTKVTSWKRTRDSSEVSAR